MEVDVKQTTKIVDIWYEKQHERIIKRLAKRKEIQLEYITRIITDKEDMIMKYMNEPTATEEAQEEYRKYKDLLELHVSLLCDLAPEKVLEAVKKKYYPVNECQRICSAKKNNRARAYLLKRAGDYSESLRVYIDILREIGDNLINITNKKDFDDLDNSFNDYFHKALKVCLKNAKVTLGDASGESLWFDLIDYLYEIMMGVFDKKEEVASSETREVHKILTKSINICIKDVLTQMMVYVGFPRIMTRLTEKHGELEIESFKEMFTSMLSSYFYNEKILDTAAKIISNDIVLQFKNLSGLRCKALQVMDAKCSKCETRFSEKDEENIAIFQCGHIYHGRCFDNKDTCYACSHKEISNLQII